jgi:mannitol/fructose-specific phosphotransferase system IIA component (Ntr-type)
MRLSDFIARDAVNLDLQGATRDAVLEEMVRLIGFDERSSATLLRILRRRENLGSTGVGRGLALPHCRSLVAPRLKVAFGRQVSGVEWQAIDNRPVHHVFLIVAPPIEVSNQYLPVLGRIAQFAKEADIPETLAGLPTPDDFFALLEARGA